MLENQPSSRGGKLNAIATNRNNNNANNYKSFPSIYVQLKQETPTFMHNLSKKPQHEFKEALQHMFQKPNNKQASKKWAR